MHGDGHTERGTTVRVRRDAWASSFGEAPPGQVAWVRPEALSARSLGTLAGLIDADERARAARFAFEADRRAFIAAHGLLRLALSYSLPISPKAWQLDYDACGKPAVTCDGVAAPAFSLSHTRTMVACAVLARAGGLGLDVVEIGTREPEAGLLAASCTAGELARLRAQPPDRRALAFAHLWALKEAAAKALGFGAEFVAAHFEFTSERTLRANAHVTDAAARACAFTTLLPTMQHVVAIARPAECAELAVTAVNDEWVTFGPTRRDG
jgi:4'-phosphopantetheinyl transferase